MKPTDRPLWQAAKPSPTWLFARSAVADGDDILAPLDVVRARWRGCKALGWFCRLTVYRTSCSAMATPGSQAIEAFNGREPRRLDPALHHAPFAINHLHLGQPHQVTRMVDVFSRTQSGDLVVLPQERRQLQRFQMVGEQDLRCVGHTAAPANRSMLLPRRCCRDRRFGKIRIDRHVEAWPTPLDAAYHILIVDRQIWFYRHSRKVSLNSDGVSLLEIAISSFSANLLTFLRSKSAVALIKMAIALERGSKVMKFISTRSLRV